MPRPATELQHSRVSLWVICRTRSTMIVKILSAIPDTSVIFEPLIYIFNTALFPTAYTLGHLRDQLAHKPFTNDRIIWKDSPALLTRENFQDWVFEDYRHVILIRDPAAVARSKVTLDGVTLNMYQFLKARTETHPPLCEEFSCAVDLIGHLKARNLPFKVFDTTNVVSNAAAQVIVKDICEFGNLPYSEDLVEKMPSLPFLGGENWWRVPGSADIIDESGERFNVYNRAMTSTAFSGTTSDIGELTSQVDETDLEKCLSKFVDFSDEARVRIVQK